MFDSDGNFLGTNFVEKHRITEVGCKTYPQGGVICKCKACPRESKDGIKT